MNFSNGAITVTNRGTRLVQGDRDIYMTTLEVLNVAKPTSTKVCHFHWRSWPDRGVPENHLAVLRLLHHIQQYGRVVVHCSAGEFHSSCFVVLNLNLSTFFEF